jgi:hypothetical protein
MKATIVAFLACSVFASLFESVSSLPTATRNRGVNVCDIQPKTNRDMLIYYAKGFASDTSSTSWRSSLGIPLVPDSGITVHLDSLACVTAAASYRAFRVNSGGGDFPLEVYLARIGSTGYYFGTSFYSPMRDVTEYIVFNSQLGVVSVRRYLE